MTSRQHKEPPTIFIDRNSGGRTFRALIEAEGIEVILHSDVFRDDTIADHAWLESVSEKGWIVVTGDQATSRSLLFLDQLNRTRTHVFILYMLNGASPEMKARHVIELYPWMTEKHASCEPPSLWRVTQNDRNRVDIADALGRAKKRLKNSRQPRIPR